MTILKSIVDNIGDVLGTSKLATLNNRMFRPLLGTGISRRNYNRCHATDYLRVPDRHQAAKIKSLEGSERLEMANDVLEIMVDNGAVFNDDQIVDMAEWQQTEAGTTNLSHKVRDQLSDSGSREMSEMFREQRKLKALRYM